MVEEGQQAQRVRWIGMTVEEVKLSGWGRKVVQKPFTISQTIQYFFMR